MASKQDVITAFYEGVCTVLRADHTNSIGHLELDMEEFREFLDHHPEYEDCRFYLGN